MKLPIISSKATCLPTSTAQASLLNSREPCTCLSRAHNQGLELTYTLNSMRPSHIVGKLAFLFCSTPQNKRDKRLIQTQEIVSHTLRYYSLRLKKVMCFRHTVGPQMTCACTTYPVLSLSNANLYATLGCQLHCMLACSAS